MNDKFIDTIRRYTMIQPGQDVMACVSGGADSMALLILLLRHRQELEIGRVSACHLNHGLRGAESDSEQAHVEEFCTARGVALVTERADLHDVALKGESLETAARRLRYEFFESAAQRLGAVRIAVAHTMDDLGETVLFNLVRGTGIRGLRGIPPVRGAIIRPLIAFSRLETEEVCQQEGIGFAVDSSNSDTGYSRNRIRHNVIPELVHINQSAVENIARLAGKAALAEDFLDACAARLEESARIDERPIWVAAKLARGDRLLVHYCFRQILERYGIQPAESLINLACQVLDGRLNGVQLSGGLALLRRGAYLCLRECGDGARGDAPVFCFPLTAGDHPLPNGFVVRVREIERDQDEFVQMQKNSFHNCMDCGTISGNAILRNRLAGDVFTSHRRGCTKKVKKWLQEQQLPVGLRDTVPVISDGEKILWLYREGVCARSAVHAGTQRMVHITVLERANE